VVALEAVLAVSLTAAGCWSSAAASCDAAARDDLMLQLGLGQDVDEVAGEVFRGFVFSRETVATPRPSRVGAQNTLTGSGSSRAAGPRISSGP
jgi:hypothetical protein